MFIKYFFLVVLTMYPFLSQAQIALPPMDPSFPTLLPAAAGWRKKFRAAALIYELEEDRPKSVYFVEKGMENRGGLLSISMPTSGMVVEGIVSRVMTESNHPNGKDQFLENYFSLGAAFDMWNGKLGFGFNGRMLSVDTSSRYSRIYSPNLSFSKNILSFFYVAGGISFNMHQIDGAPSNYWLERTVALGMKLTETFGPQVEIGWIHSPRRRQAKHSKSQVNHHPETDILTAMVELDLFLFLIHGDVQIYADKASSEMDYENTFAKGRAGLSMNIIVPGLRLGAYYSYGKKQAAPEGITLEEKELTTLEAYEVGASLSF